ncbi:MAG: XisI protein [Lewinellaceae bacterium]|nr:XisI protein [Phaeodactylibacter sp.]MCB9041500.1 XisI protein [Lewinellaceae bacterium]
MGKVEAYKKIVSKLIEEIGNLGAKPGAVVKTQIIKDEPNGHYLLFSNGWRGDDRVYGCYLHIDISADGKIWLQHDGTDLVVAQKLLDQGIPKTDIVLAFHAPFVREDTGFALS